MESPRLYNNEPQPPYAQRLAAKLEALAEQHAIAVPPRVRAALFATLTLHAPHIHKSAEAAEGATDAAAICTEQYPRNDRDSLRLWARCMEDHDEAPAVTVPSRAISEELQEASPQQEETDCKDGTCPLPPHLTQQKTSAENPLPTSRSQITADAVGAILAHLNNRQVDTRWRTEYKGRFSDAINAFKRYAESVPDKRAREYVAQHGRIKALLASMVANNYEAYEDLVTLAAENKIDLRLIYAIIAVESGGKVDAVSPSGARGLMQMHKAAFNDLIRDLRKSDPAGNWDRYTFADLTRDPLLAINLGTRYFLIMLHAAHVRNPDITNEELVPTALALYNQGPNMRSADAKKEAAKYVERVAAALKAYRLSIQAAGK